jgi:hypothetical protein
MSEQILITDLNYLDYEEFYYDKLSEIVFQDLDLIEMLERPLNLTFNHCDETSPFNRTVSVKDSDDNVLQMPDEIINIIPEECIFEKNSQPPMTDANQDSTEDDSGSSSSEKELIENLNSCVDDILAEKRTKFIKPLKPGAPKPAKLTKKRKSEE